jgi:hypothetical protein
MARLSPFRSIHGSCYGCAKQTRAIARAPVFPTLSGMDSGGKSGLSAGFTRIMDKAKIKGRLIRERNGVGRSEQTRAASRQQSLSRLEFGLRLGGSTGKFSDELEKETNCNQRDSKATAPTHEPGLPDRSPRSPDEMRQKSNEQHHATADRQNQPTNI